MPWPCDDRCTRIWCVRPVLMVTSSRLIAGRPCRGRAAIRLRTLTSVTERMPSGSSAVVTRTRRSPSGSRYLCSGESMTFLFAGQLPWTRAR
ncbi:hypothetical protein D3C78_1316090 [compost metagenome]